jgi:hypothetical protein
MDNETSDNQPRMQGIYGHTRPMTEEEREEALMEAHKAEMKAKEREAAQRQASDRKAATLRRQYWNRPLSERLLEGSAHIHKTGCRIWRRSLDGQGYGTMGLNGKRVKVHRVSFEAIYGGVDAPLKHTCGRKSCINPDHIVVKGQPDFPRIPRREGIDVAWRETLIEHF